MDYCWKITDRLLCKALTNLPHISRKKRGRWRLSKQAYIRNDRTWQKIYAYEYINSSLRVSNGNFRNDNEKGRNCC